MNAPLVLSQLHSQERARKDKWVVAAGGHTGLGWCEIHQHMIDLQNTTISTLTEQYSYRLRTPGACTV